MPRSLQRMPFHLEHVIARQHLGATALENLAWACSHCNLHKGPNIAGLDPDTGALVPLFNPRRDRWSEHFAFNHVRIDGRTGVGRATVIVLNLNDPAYIAFRESLAAERLYPPGL